MYNKLLMFYTQITVFAIHDLPYGLLALLCQCWTWQASVPMPGKRVDGRTLFSPYGRLPVPLP